MEQKIADEEIQTRLRSAFRSLREVEDKLEMLTKEAPYPKGYPVSEQAREKLKAALSELNIISDSLESNSN